MIDGLEFKLAKIDLAPDDVLVVKVIDSIISSETAKRIRSIFEVDIGHKRILVIDQSMELSVLAPVDGARSDAGRV